MSSSRAAPYDHFDGRQAATPSTLAFCVCCAASILYFYKYAGATEFAQLTHSALAATSKTTTILAKYTELAER